MSSSPVRSLAASIEVVFFLLFIIMLWATTNASIVIAEQDMSYESPNQYVDLGYLAVHLSEFESQSVTTNGIVRFYGSFFMFEDFWLESQNNAKIPVVTRFAGLSVPPSGFLIEISGAIRHSNLEGGFYFLNASIWETRNATPTPIPTPTPTASSIPTSNPTSTSTSTPSNSPNTNASPTPKIPEFSSLIYLIALILLALVGVVITKKQTRKINTC